MAKHAVEMARHAGGGGGSGAEQRGGPWAQDVAWAPGDGGWGGGEEGAREGAGQTLVHETHAPKRISHIQFGLLNSEVQWWCLYYEQRGSGRGKFHLCCMLLYFAHVSVVCMLSRACLRFDLDRRGQPRTLLLRCVDFVLPRLSCMPTSPTEHGRLGCSTTSERFIKLRLY